MTSCKGSEDRLMRAAGLLVACTGPLVSAMDVDAAGSLVHGPGWV